MEISLGNSNQLQPCSHHNSYNCVRLQILPRFCMGTATNLPMHSRIGSVLPVNHMLFLVFYVN